MLTGEQLVKRQADLAIEDNQGWLSQQQDYYKFCAPYRDPGQQGSNPTGPRKPVEVFDATAVASSFRGAGRLQRGLTPDYQSWVALQPGPLVPQGAAREQFKRVLSDVTAIALALFNQGGFAVAAAEMYLDLFAGNGAMMVVRGDEAELVKFISIPPEHVQTADDSTGRTKLWIYRQEICGDDIAERWPNAKIPSELKKLLAADTCKKHPFLLSCERLAPREFAFKVVHVASKAAIWEEALRTSCFITPRFFKAPNQRRGAGPALLAMPTIKTLNKSVEFELKAAAFAILGAWMTTDDGVYNPRTSSLSPGGMLKVARTGGPLGASMARLPIPDNFDLSRLISQDLRIQIREILYDNELPMESGAVRSPTEIVERLKRLATDMAGAFGRLQVELIVPLVQRVLDIADQWGLLPSYVQIDNLLVKAQVTSPLAQTQALEEIEKAVRWVELVGATLGPQEAQVMVDPEAMGPFLHENLGANVALLRDAKARKQMREEIRKAAMAAYEAEAAKMAQDEMKGRRKAA